MMAYPLAKSGKLSIPSAVLDKALRLMPAVISIMALDMIWYLPLDGPFVSRVGKVILDKCSKTWWKTALFMNNLWGPSIEIVSCDNLSFKLTFGRLFKQCSGHTYSTSVDVQLFIIGLVGVWLLAKRPKVGILYCITWMMVGNLLTFYYATIHKVTPTLMVANNPYIHNLEQFLIYVHMATSSYIPSYFCCILTGYTIHLGVWKRFSKNINHLMWFMVISVTHLMSAFSPILTNTLNILPEHLNPIFIVTVRTLVMIQAALILIYFSLTSDSNDDVKRKDDQEVKSGSSDVEKVEQLSYLDQIIRLNDHESYSVLKAFLRLSFAIYMSNYLYIRTDFMTERNLFHTSIYVLIKRIVSSFAFIIIVSVIFHLMFVAPFGNLMHQLKSQKSKKLQ